MKFSLMPSALTGLIMASGILNKQEAGLIAEAATATAGETTMEDLLANGDLPENSAVFKHFVAMHDTHTCVGDEHAFPFNNQIRGVNLGGWMVLEPWITPSLFYQFLGGKKHNTAMDSYTFCQVLGKEEANRQLKRHWETWVTEDHIKELAKSGNINSLRLPVGDYMFRPYGPYVSETSATLGRDISCWDGALDYVDQVLEWAYEYGLSVLIDIHAMKDSQNGFDNSGQAMGLEWTAQFGEETFQHWPIRKAQWMGEFDPESKTYPVINHDNIDHALDVISLIAQRWGDHPAVLGLEPINEPWELTPIEELKQFYWEGYLRVKEHAPRWKYIIHDSFRLDPEIWGGFMAGCPDRAMDAHIYQAWDKETSRLKFYNEACGMKGKLAAIEDAFGPVVLGEWSLATDNCAMWLNGFNDNLPGYPTFPCKYVECSAPYMGLEQPGTPVDTTKGLQGPFGTAGLSGPIYGFCPIERDWYKEGPHTMETGQGKIKESAEAPPELRDTDNVMKNLYRKKMHSLTTVSHGHYFWNFRTDLQEPAWSYLLAMERGWIPRKSEQFVDIEHACAKEDLGLFVCTLKEEASAKNIIGALQYIDYVNNKDLPPEDVIEVAYDVNDPNLIESTGANQRIDDFFQAHRLEGATCDFGGIALLVEENKTFYPSMAPTMPPGYGPSGPSPVEMLVIVLVAVICGFLVGFVVAMRCSPGFNQHVRGTKWFKPITKSNSKILRSSLALPALETQGELDALMKDVNGMEYQNTGTFS